MPAPEIIYESKDFLAVNKPAGLVVHAARISHNQFLSSKREKTLVDWLLERFPEIQTVGDDLEARPGIVHRLDRETSGVMLVARTQEGFEYLKSLFQKHEIKKTYLVLVRGIVKPREGMIDKPIGIKNGTLKRSVHSEKMAKEAVTEYRVLTTYDQRLTTNDHRQFSLLEVMPKTGRTHQIRVHLASIGHPVVGDRLYGGKSQLSNVNGQLSVSRLMLHATSLEFTTAEGERLRLEAEPPEDFREIISSYSVMAE